MGGERSGKWIVAIVAKVNQCDGKNYDERVTWHVNNIFLFSFTTNICWQNNEKLSKIMKNCPPKYIFRVKDIAAKIFLKRKKIEICLLSELFLHHKCLWVK